jgi:hypothetical protein
VAEITGLLNRRTVLSRTGGSNPPLTAEMPLKPAKIAGFCFLGSNQGAKLLFRFFVVNNFYSRCLEKQLLLDQKQAKKLILVANFLINNALHQLRPRKATRILIENMQNAIIVRLSSL